MDLHSLERLLLLCLMIATSIYAVTALALIAFGERVYKINMRIFSLSKQSVAESVQNYLAMYKLLMTIFIFTPWLALFIYNS